MQEDLHFKLRIPPALYERLKVKAQASKRTLTGEILAAIEAALDGGDAHEHARGVLMVAQLNKLEEITRDLAEQKVRLDQFDRLLHRKQWEQMNAAGKSAIGEDELFLEEVIAPHTETKPLASKPGGSARAKTPRSKKT